MSGKPAEPMIDPQVALGSFDLIMAEEEYRKLPTIAALMRIAVTVQEKYVSNASSAFYLSYLPDEMREVVASGINKLENGSISVQEGRKMFSEMATSAQVRVKRFCTYMLLRAH